MNTVRWFTAMAAIVLIAGSGSAAMAAAQAEGQGPGMPPPGGGRGFEGGPGTMPRRMPPPPITAATIPVSAMKGYLNLTDAQHGKIADITDDLRDELRPTPPIGRPAGPGEDGGSRGERPEPPGMGGGGMRRLKADAAIKKASAAVESVLTDDQRHRLPTLLQALTALRADRITLEAVAKLKLSDDQVTKLAALGATATSRKVERVLTDEQLDIAERYRAPGGGSGGRDGGGPPRRGGQQGFGGPNGGPPNGGPPEGGPPNGGPPGGGYPFGGPPNGGPPPDGGGGPPQGGPDGISPE